MARKSKKSSSTTWDSSKSPTPWWKESVPSNSGLKVGDDARYTRSDNQEMQDSRDSDQRMDGEAKT